MVDAKAVVRAGEMAHGKVHYSVAKLAVQREALLVV